MYNHLKNWKYHQPTITVMLFLIDCEEQVKALCKAASSRPCRMDCNATSLIIFEWPEKKYFMEEFFCGSKRITKSVMNEKKILKEQTFTNIYLVLQTNSLENKFKKRRKE